MSAHSAVMLHVRAQRPRPFRRMVGTRSGAALTGAFPPPLFSPPPSPENSRRASRAADPRRAYCPREHEMIGIADEVQLGRLARALEQLDRLFRGCDRVVGRV